jgi:hypothetical protein
VWIVGTTVDAGNPDLTVENLRIAMWMPRIVERTAVRIVADQVWIALIASWIGTETSGIGILDPGSRRGSLPGRLDHDADQHFKRWISTDTSGSPPRSAAAGRGSARTLSDHAEEGPGSRACTFGSPLESAWITWTAAGTGGLPLRIGGADGSDLADRRRPDADQRGQADPRGLQASFGSLTRSTFLDEKSRTVVPSCAVAPHALDPLHGSEDKCCRGPFVPMEQAREQEDPNRVKASAALGRRAHRQEHAGSARDAGALAACHRRLGS